MTTLYIAEFASLYAKNEQTGQMCNCPPLAEQALAIGTVVSSAAFNAATNIIRVHTDNICSIAFGAAPVATTANMRLAANQTEYFAVPGGTKLSVIINT